MNTKGKRELIESLTIAIGQWLDIVDPNKDGATDIGYVGNETTKLMATVAVTLLEANSEAQRYAIREGYLHP